MVKLLIASPDPAPGSCARAVRKDLLVLRRPRQASAIKLDPDGARWTLQRSPDTPPSPRGHQQQV